MSDLAAAWEAVHAAKVGIRSRAELGRVMAADSADDKRRSPTDS